MVLRTLASGSNGNCYLLETPEECLVLEAGIPFRDVKIALDFNVRKIVGVLITHQHADHAKYANQYVKEGIKVFMPYLGNNDYNRFFGGFQVKAFPLINREGAFQHTNTDYSECPCYGFLLHHHDMSSMIYITDCGFVRWNFKKLKIHHFLIECNYADQFLGLNAHNKDHVLSGHMELQTTKKFIEANETEAVETVTLCHLSNDNADAELFANKIQAITKGKVTIATKNAWVDLQRKDLGNE